jgi:hypothetical protein
MMKRIKEYMSHPYTRGDYWGAAGIAMALYAVIAAIYVVYMKIDDWKSNKKIRKTDVYSIEDEEV